MHRLLSRRGQRVFVKPSVPYELERDPWPLRCVMCKNTCPSYCVFLHPSTPLLLLFHIQGCSPLPTDTTHLNNKDPMTLFLTDFTAKQKKKPESSILWIVIVEQPFLRHCSALHTGRCRERHTALSSLQKC